MIVTPRPRRPAGFRIAWLLPLLVLWLPDVDSEAKARSRPRPCCGRR